MGDNHGFKDQEIGGRTLLQEYPYPVIRGKEANLITPARFVEQGKRGESALGVPGLTDHKTSWPPHLSPKMIVQSDGEHTIIRLKPIPSFAKKDHGVRPTNQSAPPICIPADVISVDVTPFEDPLVLGNTYTFTGFGVSGTTPITYEWYIDSGAGGVLRSISASFVYTLIDSDITSKDGSGLGKLIIYLIVKNACNTSGTSTDPAASYNAQGTP